MKNEDFSYTPREVAVLSHTPLRLVEKAIEEAVIPVRLLRPSTGGRPRRLLPCYAVGYARLIGRLDLSLRRDQKKRLAAALAAFGTAAGIPDRLEIAPAVEIDTARLLGEVAIAAARYREARDRLIVSDPGIQGGTPVIRGTRITVYAILGRIDGGEGVEEILEDYPYLTRDAVEAAATYARAHPLVGRPGDRPWRRAA